MIFGVVDFLVAMTRDRAVSGDVVGMGTEGATADLKHGDVVEVAITGIGTLRNPVVEAAQIRQTAVGQLLGRRSHVVSQIPRDLYRDGMPVGRRRLAIKPERRIPRAVATFDQPTPAWNEAVHQPDRLAEGAREVDDGGINRNDQVEVLDQRRGVGKVDHFTHEIHEREMLRCVRAFFLEAEEIHAGHLKQRRQQSRGMERRRPIARSAGSSL